MKWLTYVLVVLQACPLYAVNIPIGVARMGEYRLDDEKAYAVLERRIQRWVENNEILHLEAKSIGATLKQDEILPEINRLRFSKAVEEIKSALNAKTDLEKISPKITAMRELRKKVEILSETGPAVQNSLVMEALYQWKKKDYKGAEANLRRAAKIHPEASINSPFSWESMTNGNESLAGFETLLTRAVRAQSRECVVTIKGEPVKKAQMEDVYANGFRLGKKRELHLNSGMLYRISKGPEFEQTLVRCERQSTVKVTLPTKRIPVSKGLKALTKEGVLSAFVVQADKTGFKLNLFTPGVGFDEIALDKQLKRKDILQNPTEEGIPVSKQAFTKLVETHRLASLKMHSLLPAGHPSPVMVSQLDHKVEQGHKWYNHWAFWAITGTVLTGAAIAYFASKDSGVGATKAQLSATFE